MNSTHSKWRIAVAGYLGMVVSSPAVLSVNPLLLKPTSLEFGWSRATISSAYLIAAPIMAVLYLFIGPALDRFGVRRMLLVGYISFGLATALVSQMDGSIFQLFAYKALVTCFATLPTGIAFGKVISSHFTERRGTMLGFCLGAGGGSGMAIMPLLGAYVLEQAGWRMTYVAVGLFAMLLGLVAVALLPNDRPAAGADKAPPSFGIPGHIAMRSATFVTLLAGTLFSCMVLNGTVAHLAAINTDAGMSTTQAALALSVYALSMVAGQFGVGILLDRVDTPRIIIPILITATIGLLFLYFALGSVSAFAGAACLGLSAGSEYGLLPYMVTRYFGLRSFGQLYALIYASASIGTGVGPFALGTTYDLTGSYDRALLAFVAILILVIVLLARLPGYAFTVKGERLSGLSPDDATSMAGRSGPA